MSYLFRKPNCVSMLLSSLSNTEIRKWSIFIFSVLSCLHSWLEALVWDNLVSIFPFLAFFSMPNVAEGVEYTRVAFYFFSAVVSEVPPDKFITIVKNKNNNKMLLYRTPSTTVTPYYSTCNYQNISCFFVQ